MVDKLSEGKNSPAKPGDSGDKISHVAAWHQISLSVGTVRALLGTRAGHSASLSQSLHDPCTAPASTIEAEMGPRLLSLVERVRVGKKA
jgi:hypothetical protein